MIHLRFLWVLGLFATSTGFAQVTESMGDFNAEHENCLSAIEQLIYDSDRFQEKVGNINFGMMLVESPNPSRDGIDGFSPLYEFNITENLDDHITSIARFAFDAQMVKLFEYDPIEDEYLEIPIHRMDAEEVGKQCKD